MATAKTEIEILVDGGGKLVDARAFDQVLEKFEDITPQRCALCGSSDIKDMDKSVSIEEKMARDSGSPTKTPHR